MGIGTIKPSVPLHVVKSPTAFTDIPMQEWDPAIAGYKLILSNFNSIHGIDYRFTQFTNGTPYPILVFQGSNIGIGTTTPDSRLAVTGTVHSKEVKVDLTGWADYVFNPKYKLLSLRDVKSYIHENHHLPDMPSEEQVAKNGLNLGEMNKMLTMKIEELTLYLIEKDNQMDRLKDEVKELKQQHEELKQQLSVITKALNN